MVRFIEIVLPGGEEKAVVKLRLRSGSHSGSGQAHSGSLRLTHAHSGSLRLSLALNL